MEKFYISFSGETLPGHDRDAAKQGLADFFQLDKGVELDTFFSGQKFILKRNLDRDTATKIYLALRKLGLLTKIEREVANPQRPKKRSAVESLQRLVSKPSNPATRKPPTSSPPTGTGAKPAQPRPRPAAKQEPAPGGKPVHGAAGGPPSPGNKTAADLAARGARGGRSAAERQARDPGRIIKAVPSATVVDEPIQEKRQLGEPNYFDLRLADGAFKEHETHEDHFSQPARIGALIILLAFILVAFRFWVETFATPASGLGAVTVDPESRPVVVVNDQLLKHDRAGNPGELADASAIGLTPATAIDFLPDGDLLVHLPARGADSPEWSHSILGIEAKPGRLARCSVRAENCRPLVSPLNTAAFAVDQRSASVFVADVDGNRLLKLAADGAVLAMRALALEEPASLSLHDDVVYLTQGDAVIALVGSERNFGDERGRHTLAVDGAQATGHIFPRATVRLEEHWWVLMQSRDGSTSGLYRFTPDWQYAGTAPLSEGAEPGNPVRWGSKLLVPDSVNETVYRVAADNSLEKPFSADAISKALADRRESLEFSRSLQVVVLLVMFFAALSLYTFGTIKSLQGKIYKALSDTDEHGFDISNEDILWLDPAPEARVKLRRLCFLFGVVAVLALAGAVTAGAGLGAIVAILLVSGGVAGYFYAIYQSWDCHMGLLEDELVVIDHNNAYRIGKGPKIQYVNNYVMIDDVIVYLGNRLVQQFDPKPLRHRFAPLVRRGIRVDKTTLRLKLINSRHPMFYGSVGLALAALAATLLVILA